MDGEVITVLKQIPPRFTIDGSNKLRGRSDVNLSPSLSARVREFVSDYYNQICNAYEATTIVLPGRQLQAKETWQAQNPLLLKTGKKAEVADLVLTCTYEGTRQRQGRREALITLTGYLKPRQTKTKMDSLVNGQVALDLEGGFISMARLSITTEFDMPDGEFRFVAAFDIDLRRSPGNPLQIAVGGASGVKPTPVPKGKLVARTVAQLTPADPFMAGTKSRAKVFPVQLEAGKRYIIQMNSGTFDTYLRLLDPAGQQIAVDDDSGGNLNALIDIRAPSSGGYRIIATSYDGKLGPFELIVTEVP
jgi:hypothetical protein